MQIIEDGLIYWEKQENDELCAVYALNSLLQYPYWDAPSLARVANELDDLESSIIYKKMGKSENVAETGYFSIQTIQKALHELNLTLNYFVDIEKSHLQEAFICNFYNHWISLRNIRNKWYNLNSLNKAPEFISELCLSSMIYQIKEEGFTIFSVTGNFPKLVLDKQLQKNQMFIKAATIHEKKNEILSPFKKIISVFKIDTPINNVKFTENNKKPTNNYQENEYHYNNHNKLNPFLARYDNDIQQITQKDYQKNIEEKQIRLAIEESKSQYESQNLIYEMKTIEKKINKNQQEKEIQMALQMSLEFEKENQKSLQEKEIQMALQMSLEFDKKQQESLQEKEIQMALQMSLELEKENQESLQEKEVQMALRMSLELDKEKQLSLQEKEVQMALQMSLEYEKEQQDLRKAIELSKRFN